MHASCRPDLSIIIVSYNTRAMTLACLDSIIAETNGTNFEIIVVDNASRDSSADAIAAHPAKPQLIALDGNIGFARANNVAARAARGSFILLLNPDTVVLDGAIDKLMAFAGARPAAKIWGGRTLFADGTLNPSSCWGRMTMWNLFCRAAGLTAVFAGSELFNGEAYGGWRRDKVRQVDIVSGCFFLVPRALWHELGGFDPSFFMYGEEADLCLRARAAGARPLITPDATIVHHGGASEPGRLDKMTKLLTAKAGLIRRHWRPELVRMGIALLTLWPLSRWLILAALYMVLGHPAHRDAAQCWRALWRARADWSVGYAREQAARRPAGAGAVDTSVVDTSVVDTSVVDARTADACVADAAAQTAIPAAP